MLMLLTGAPTIFVSMVTSEVSPEPFTVLPNSAVKVSLTLGNNLVLASDETLQVSADHD
jgi:hypothetical protein